MGLMNTTGERLRRATQLWHGCLAATGQRFDLAQFLSDPLLEKQTLDAALASGDQNLMAIAHDWLRDSGQALPATVATRGVAPAPAPAPPGATGGTAAAEPAKPGRYLRGVR